MTDKPTPAETLRQIASARGMGHLQMIERARAVLLAAQEQEKLIGELCLALWAELGDEAKKIPAYRRGRQIIGAEGKFE